MELKTKGKRKTQEQQSFLSTVTLWIRCRFFPFLSPAVTLCLDVGFSSHAPALKMKVKFTKFVTATFLAFSVLLLFLLSAKQGHNSWLPSYAKPDGLEDAWYKMNTGASKGQSGLAAGARGDTTNTTNSTFSSFANATASELIQSHKPLLLDNIFDVQNATLGAQDVFVVSLPTRRDKHDAFAVQAMASNITYKIVAGVDGESVPKKALPFTMDLKPVEIGCWRAHMNVFEDMLDRRIATAIVFEDDADWEVAFRQQLLQFARGSRYITGTEPKGGFVPHSPYGEDWDVLWLGHCNSRPTRGDNKRFVLEHDPTVVPLSERQSWEQPITRYWDKPGSDFKTRVVFRTSDSSCTTAYAISLKGAQKALYYLSMNPSNDPIDNAMGHLCGDADKDFKCISSFPTLVGISKPAGSSDRGSDVGHEPSDASISDKAHSERLVYSTRMNLQNLLTGNQKMVSAYPYDSPHANISDITIPQGYKFEFSEEDLAEMAAEDAAEKERAEEAKLQQHAMELEAEKQKIAAQELELQNSLNALPSVQVEQTPTAEEPTTPYSGADEQVAPDFAIAAEMNGTEPSVAYSRRAAVKGPA